MLIKKEIENKHIKKELEKNVTIAVAKEKLIEIEAVDIKEKS